jgi:hypothetical protein
MFAVVADRRAFEEGIHFGIPFAGAAIAARRRDPQRHQLVGVALTLGDMDRVVIAFRAHPKQVRQPIGYVLDLGGPEHPIFAIPMGLRKRLVFPRSGPFGRIRALFPINLPQRRTVGITIDVAFNELVRRA